MPMPMPMLMPVFVVDVRVTPISVVLGLSVVGVVVVGVRHGACCCLECLQWGRSHR
jgi:hypothetical protein